MIVIKTKSKKGKVKKATKASKIHPADQYFSEKALESARRDNGFSRDRLVYMRVEDFLALARNGFDAAKERTVSLLLRDNIPLESIPYLKVDNDTKKGEEVGTSQSAKNWQVVGHEGRHRARALRALGVKEVPVVICHSTMRWEKSKNRPKYIWAEKPKTDALLFKDVVREA